MARRHGADRYGQRKVTKMYAEVQALREIIRAEGTPAIQEAWDKVEEHIDYAYRRDDTPSAGHLPARLET